MNCHRSTRGNESSSRTRNFTGGRSLLNASICSLRCLRPVNSTSSLSVNQRLTRPPCGVSIYSTKLAKQNNSPRNSTLLNWRQFFDDDPGLRAHARGADAIAVLHQNPQRAAATACVEAIRRNTALFLDSFARLEAFNFRCHVATPGHSRSASTPLCMTPLAMTMLGAHPPCAMRSQPS